MDTNLSQPCDWCARKGVPGDGDGQFRDVDVDFNKFSYPGIPICGGCGGLGIQFDDEDFKSRVERIMKLRFEFHPTDDLPEPPTSLPYAKLKEMLREVEELTQKYGLGSEKSYARWFIDPKSPFREVLPMMEECIAEELTYIKEHGPEVTPEAVEEVRESMITLYSGDIDRGLELYKQAMEKFPQDSGICHDFGTLLIIFKRDKTKALEYFQKSTTLEPKKALHFFQTAKTLILLGRYPEAISILEETKLLPDYARFEVENDDLSVDNMILRANLLIDS